jgi:hypothetical protein
VSTPETDDILAALDELEKRLAAAVEGLRQEIRALRESIRGAR